MTRRDFSASLAAPLAAQSSKRPNIVWIMADDLGWGDVGFNGQKKIRTPNIDRIAAEGTKFTDAYSGCTVCAPSRSVLMTGMHMGHTSIRSNPGGVPLLESDLTIAEVLKKAGYATGGFGKWGLGDTGTAGAAEKKGFDEFYGYYHQVHAHYHYPSVLIDNGREVPLPKGTYAPDAIAERALQFVRKNSSKPFFAYLPFTIPHWELLVPEDSLAEYRGKFPEDVPYITERKHYADQVEARACYAGMITRMDGYIGRLMNLLKESNLDRDTCVFFTSDNGGASRLYKNENYFDSYGPFRGHKQNFYEGGIRVPMAARWPGRIPAGRTSNFAWMFQDFFATACDIAGIPAPKTDGMSVVPTLTGRTQKPHEFLYWEQPRYIGKTAEFAREIPMQAVRMGDWKAVRPQPNGPLELYNLKSDIGETKNVAAEQPQVMAKIETYLKTARTEPRPQKNPPHDWDNRK
ncbi:MAG: arylsulfatase [Bryobacteraceae bacterium]|nr:arylsulfatase [Bryobacteraceae bacterium]